MHHEKQRKRVVEFAPSGITGNHGIPGNDCSLGHLIKQVASHVQLAASRAPSDGDVCGDDTRFIDFRHFFLS
uniref:Uncharacterized protein n=1 Tax=Rhizophora mucronata TaxID=61149 RepID=A0A2P2P445_RHIMU